MSRASLDELSDRKSAKAVATGQGRLRATLLELWQRTRMDWGFVTDRLSATFRQEKWIGGHDRRFLSETLYGMIRNLRRIDLALTLANHRQAAPRDLDRVIGYLVLTQLLSPDDAALAVPLDWRAALAVDDKIAQERKPATKLGLAASLPDWLAQALLADWGDLATNIATSLNQRAPMTVRANLLVTDRAGLRAKLASEALHTSDGRWCDTAVSVESRTNLFGTQAFVDGAMEAQDEGSQLLADVAVPRGPRSASGLGAIVPGTVVDFCAGAGGKTLAIAARMGNKGRVVATDVDGSKLQELRKRARRGQVTIAQAMAIDDDDLPPQLLALHGKADVVLVDAPCSGIGALRRSPEARFRLQPADIAAMQKQQTAILKRAAAFAKPGGTVVYATCTLLRAENQQVIDAVAPSLGAALVPIADHMAVDASFDQQGAFTSLPSVHNTDGFFAQVLRMPKA